MRVIRHITERLLWCVGIITSAAMPLTSQAPPAQKPSFEVVIIRPAPYGQSVKKLIGYGYLVRDFQIVGGPDWVSTDRWDIQSKAEDANDHAPEPLIVYATQPDPFSLMVQSILEDRFQFKVHRETRELPVYELIVAPGGPKMRLADDHVAAGVKIPKVPV